MAGKQTKKNTKSALDDLKEKISKADLNSIFIFGAIILVLAVGLYAIFAPKPGEVIGNPACGKIVIATDGPSLRSNVSPTLAGAKYFLVVDPLTKRITEKVKNPYAAATNPGRELVYLIAGKGEEAVIVGDIDQQSYSILSQFGIKVFGGYAGSVKNVIGLYRQARVSPMADIPQAPAAPDIGNNPGAFNPNAGPAPVAFAPDINQPSGSFLCPQCGCQIIYPGAGGPAPICPRCRACMVSQNCQLSPMQNNVNIGQNAATPVAFGFGEQSFICPTCNWRMKCQRQGNAYPNCPNCGSSMAQDMSNQGFFGIKPGEILAANSVPFQNCPVQAQNYQAMQNYYQSPAAVQQSVPGYLPVNGPMGFQNNMNIMPCPQNIYQPAGAGAQGGFGYGPANGPMGMQNIGSAPAQCPPGYYQPGVMPQQGGFGYGPMSSIPCPQNYFQPVANQQQMGFGPGQGVFQNNFNQAQVQPQPNFWQGTNSNGYFICPGCNWRMYSETPLGEFPRCPNCQQIMARGGVLNQNNTAQYMPPQTMLPNMNMAGGQQVALPAQANQAPPISSNAQMAHAYRGVCTNCHQIIDAPAQTQAPISMQNDPAAAQVAATCVLR